MQRILILRNGAVGDLILTLPALRALRQMFPTAFMEVLGTPRYAILAHHPAYADQVTHPDSLDLYRLFTPHPIVSERLSVCLQACDLVLAYLPGTQAIFTGNLRRLCSGQVLVWDPHPAGQMHATEHLLRPLDALLPSVAAGPPQVYLTPAAMAAAGRFWEGVGLPGAGVIALHPGSGGRYKLWPLAGWQRLMRWVAEQGLPCVMISGPAEQEHIAWLLQETSLPTWPCATQLQLPHLAALLARCRLVVSHDSGIAHLAAAVGATTLALFGPTDPLIWGPRSRRACVLHPRVAGPLTLDNLPVERVLEVLAALYQGEWMFTPSTIDCTLVPVPPI